MPVSRTLTDATAAAPEPFESSAAWSCSALWTTPL